jgi:hypothetical protein
MKSLAPHAYTAVRGRDEFPTGNSGSDAPSRAAGNGAGHSSWGALLVHALILSWRSVIWSVKGFFLGIFPIDGGDN